MDLNWLWLIIPAAYSIISTFFLCFPNILHRKKKYHYQSFNQLIESDALYCIGHRGGSFEGPENTLEVFRTTAKHSHLFQLDICLTKDRQLVVHHDTNLRRTCGVDKDIRDLNYDQLPTFAETYKPYGELQVMKTQRNKIPLLDDLFKQFPEMPMNIDLKTPTQEGIKQFDRLVRKHQRQHLTIWGAIDSKKNDILCETNSQVVTFYSSVQILKITGLTLIGLLPFVCLRQGVLDIPLMTSEFRRAMDTFIEGSCKKCLISGVLKFFNLLSRLFIPHLKKRGILTFYWIVNEDEDFETAVSMGCSGIMTDRPSKLARYLKSTNLYFSNGSDSI